MSYSDLIQQESEYTYSANIQFDIESDTKLLRFIPNETTIKLMRDYFTDMIRLNPANHARILYGSYGTGKSHFLTVLCQVLSKSYVDGVAFSTLLSRIREYDQALANDLETYVASTETKPMLVVPIVFDFPDFNRCIYFSLKKKLDKLGYVVHFRSFYDQASSLLSQWEENEDSAKRLREICEKHSISIEDLKHGLESFDYDFEDTFNTIFSDMTFGVKYIFEVTNLIETLEQAFSAISDSYRGILFVFDEFGRYIEDNIREIKVKAVQDLAEFCDHGSGNNHVILVSHKEISQYTQSYGKALAAEWKKVEGRYRADSINNKQDQCLSLIRSILIKNEPVWKSFEVRFQSELDRMYADAMDFKGFLVDVSNGDNPFEGGFPLHPIALFVLDRLSKKVAQNDRTFFTYLASKEDNSLYRFLIRHELDEFHFVGIDEIYDYFEPSIKAVQSDESYEWYKNLLSALAKNHCDVSDDLPEVKVLKVIATIGIVNDPGALIADRRTLISTIDCPSEIVDNAINALCEKKIIKYSGIYNRFEFFDASIFDIESMITEAGEHVSNDAVIKTLNDRFVKFVLYPSEYNRTYMISRVFVPVFAVVDDLSRKNLTSRFGPYYDGVLVMVLGGVDTEDEGLIAASQEIQRSIVFVNKNSSTLIEYTKQFVAAQYLYSQKTKYIEKDPAFEKEIQYRIREISAEIKEIIYRWRTFAAPDVKIICGGIARSRVSSSAALSRLASDLMDKAFPKTLLVNNELLNKNNVSGSMSSAKKNVIRAMLAEEPAEEYYKLQYLSPEYIAVRSVLVKNGFITDSNKTSENSLPTGECPQRDIKKYLESVICRAKNDSVGFGGIYTTLKQSPYGLRDGYISLLFACVLAPQKKSLIISSHGTEQEISAELFDEIVKRPDDYTFTVTSWEEEQIQFIDQLEKLFVDYIDEATLVKNRLKAIYEAMMSHYKSVSKFARTTKIFLSNNTINYRTMLEKSYSSYSNFFFSSAKKIGGTYPGSFDAITRSKEELEISIDHLCKELKTYICLRLGETENDNLGDVLSRIYDNRWAEKKIRAFDYYTNAFLEYVSKLPTVCEDRQIVSDLAKSLTGIELTYWSDNHIDEFKTRIDDIVTKLESYQISDKLDESEIKLTLASAAGEDKTVVFSSGELSDLSKTVKNKINSTFGNFGLSITYDDKVQILLSLLGDLMEGK